MGSSKRYLRKLYVVMLLTLGLVLTGCASLPQSYLEAKGTVAEMQLEILNLTMWFAGVIGLVVTVLVLFIVFKFRAKPGQKPGVPKQIHGNHVLEVVWTIIPIGILIAVAIPTVGVAFKAYEPDKAPDYTIKAIGHQWWFEFQYEGMDVVTGNEMVIPVGKTVKLDIQSGDVIHSFWVPKLAGKVDMIPGKDNQMWLDAKEPGDYYGHCAEFCGTAHAKMRFRVKAVTQAEFDAWVADWKNGATAPSTESTKKGQEVFEANCASCHAINGTKFEGAVGPNLTNVFGRKTIAAGLADMTEDNLRKWVRDPKNFKPTDKMPSHAHIPNGEFNALIEYVKTLK